MNKLFNVFAWVHHISPMSQPSKGDKCLLLLVVIIIKIYRHTLFKIMKSVWCLIFMSRDDTHCCGWCKLIGVPSILIFVGLWQYNVTMVALWARLQIERSILPMLQLSTLPPSLSFKCPFQSHAQLCRWCSTVAKEFSANDFWKYNLDKTFDCNRAKLMSYKVSQWAVSECDL